MSEFLNELITRGYMHQCTNQEGLSDCTPITGYIGFDCTGKSLHVGSLVQIMMLRNHSETSNPSLADPHVEASTLLRT